MWSEPRNLAITALGCMKPLTGALGNTTTVSLSRKRYNYFDRPNVKVLEVLTDIKADSGNYGLNLVVWGPPLWIANHQSALQCKRLLQAVE